MKCSSGQPWIVATIVMWLNGRSPIPLPIVFLFIPNLLLACVLIWMSMVVNIDEETKYHNVMRVFGILTIIFLIQYCAAFCFLLSCSRLCSGFGKTLFSISVICT